VTADWIPKFINHEGHEVTRRDEIAGTSFVPLVSFVVSLGTRIAGHMRPMICEQVGNGMKGRFHPSTPLRAGFLAENARNRAPVFSPAYTQPREVGHSLGPHLLLAHLTVQAPMAYFHKLLWLAGGS